MKIFNNKGISNLSIILIILTVIIGIYYLFNPFQNISSKNDTISKTSKEGSSASEPKLNNRVPFTDKSQKYSFTYSKEFELKIDENNYVNISKFKEFERILRAENNSRYMEIPTPAIFVNFVTSLPQNADQNQKINFIKKTIANKEVYVSDVYGPLLPTKSYVVKINSGFIDLNFQYWDGEEDDSHLKEISKMLENEVLTIIPTIVEK
jgi:hypothetical protein